MKIFSSALNNIEISEYFNYEPRFNGVFSRKNLPKIKDVAYVMNLDDKNSKGTQWVSLFIEKIQRHNLNLLELNIFHKKY